MTVYTDYLGRSIRLTEERRQHILAHPEMIELEHLISAAIASPMRVVRSVSDDLICLYYEIAATQSFGVKLLCVVIKHNPADSFVITAYLTDRIKNGATLWARP